MSFALAVLLATAATLAPARPPQLGLCASCHTESGCSRTAGTPHLAAQDETYLRQALTAYRNGERSHAAMRALTPVDMETSGEIVYSAALET